MNSSYITESTTCPRCGSVLDVEIELSASVSCALAEKRGSEVPAPAGEVYCPRIPSELFCLEIRPAVFRGEPAITDGKVAVMRPVQSVRGPVLEEKVLDLKSIAPGVDAATTLLSPVCESCSCLILESDGGLQRRIPAVNADLFHLLTMSPRFYGSESSHLVVVRDHEERLLGVVATVDDGGAS